MKIYNKPSGYSPKEIMDLFREAEIAEGGDLESIINANKKHFKKYKVLMEMYAGIPLAICIYKAECECSSLPTKFRILPGQNPPDLYFISENSGSEFAFEVTTIYKHEAETTHFDYTAEIERIRKEKSEKYKNSDKIRSPFHLIISIRLNMLNFDLGRLKLEIQKRQRYFYSIYISIHKLNEWKIFCTFPHNDNWNINSMSFNVDKDQQYIY